MSTLRRSIALFVSASVLAACAGGTATQSPSSEPTASPIAATSVGAGVSPGPTTFTSATYGYSLTVPAGWSTVQATSAWDGTGSPFHHHAEPDQFGGSLGIEDAAASAWAFAAPTTKDLAAYVDERFAVIADVARATCPPTPELQDPIDIGGEPGTLLSWDCGLLINIAVTVHDGTGYQFGFRDPFVHAATDPADRATFVELLKSVQFPAEP